MSELILTPSDRLARALREDYAVAQRKAGKQVWRPPQIKSLRQWAQDCWVESWPSEQLLNRTQLLALWQEVIDRSDYQLISPRSCAKEALQAAQLSAQWLLDPGQLDGWTDEHEAWLSWQQQVSDKMAANHWITAEQVLDQIIEAVESQKQPLPDGLILKGFEQYQLTAQENRLVTALQNCGHAESAATEITDNANISGLLFDESRSQYEYIAKTLRERLRSYVDHNEAPPRLVIVQPEDTHKRRLLEDALHEWVAPWLKRPSNYQSVPWRWSSGQTLTSYPWVDAALSIVQLNEYDNPPEQISKWLLSSTLWTGQWREQTSAAEYALRRKAYPHPSLHAVIKASSENLKARLTPLLEVITETPSRSLPSAWAEHFTARLEAHQWPGDGNLPSQGYQAIREFRSELARLASLDSILGEITANQARGWLNELCQRRFEPRVEHLQPIHIISAHELPSITLHGEDDLLIITDASADAYPGSSHPNAFLPIDNQRQAGVPQSSPQLWLQWRKAQIESCLRQAKEIMVCRCEKSADGADLLASPFFEIEWHTPLPISTQSITESLTKATAPSARPDKDDVPPVRENENLHGSTRLFKAWAEAPFFAFCITRLGIDPLPQFGRGLPNHVQGNLLHDALEDVIGKQLITSAQINSQSDETLSGLSTKAIDQQIKRHLPVAEYGKDLIELERGRMQDLLLQWLKHEQRRVHPFKVIEAEEELNGELAGLPLVLRIDRVDEVQTDNGPAYLVIDYKTGRRVDPGGWKADSLKEPQLPLYAILGAQPLGPLPKVDGICFAHLKDGHPALSAFTNWALSLIDEKTRQADDWEESVNAWRIKLIEIVEGFLAGEANLDISSINARSFFAEYLALAGSPSPEDES